MFIQRLAKLILVLASYGLLITGIASCQFIESLSPGTSEAKLCSAPVSFEPLDPGILPEGGLYALTSNTLIKYTASASAQLEVDVFKMPHPSNKRVIADSQHGRVYASSDHEIWSLNTGLIPEGSFALDDPIEDFAVRNNHVFALSERSLWIISFVNSNNPRLVKELPFPADKPGHHIVIVDDVAYVLDNVVMPVFVHRVDIANPNMPELETLQWEGVNPYLPDQAVHENTWYVLERSTTLWGIGQALTTLTTSSPLQETGTIGLPSWASGQDDFGETDTNFYLIEQVLPVSNSQILLAGTELSDEGYRQGHLIVGAYQIASEQASLIEHLCIVDGDAQSPIASEMLRRGEHVYIAGTDGLYVIDVSDLSNLEALGKIETSQRVYSLAWMD